MAGTLEWRIRAPSASTSIPSTKRATLGHPLECPLAFWISKRKNFVDFPSVLRQLSRSETLEALKATYSRIGRPSDLFDTNLFLFRDGIEPLWEKNPEGGHWQLVLEKGLVSRCWEDLILAMIGQKFSVDSSEILGIGVSVRSNKDWISIWNQSGSDGEVIDTIGRSVREILKLPSHVTLTYRKNSEFTQWNSILKQAKFLKSLGRRDFD